MSGFSLMPVNPILYADALSFLKDNPDADIQAFVDNLENRPKRVENCHRIAFKKAQKVLQKGTCDCGCRGCDGNTHHCGNQKKGCHWYD